MNWIFYHYYLKKSLPCHANYKKLKLHFIFILLNVEVVNKIKRRRKKRRNVYPHYRRVEKKQGNLIFLLKGWYLIVDTFIIYIFYKQKILFKFLSFSIFFERFPPSPFLYSFDFFKDSLSSTPRKSSITRAFSLYASFILKFFLSGFSFIDAFRFLLFSLYVFSQTQRRSKL